MKKARIIVKIYGETYTSKYADDCDKEKLLSFLKNKLEYVQLTLENNQEILIKGEAITQCVFLVEEVSESL